MHDNGMFEEGVSEGTDKLTGYESGVENIIHYLISIHNGLSTIVLGTYKEDDKILMIHEDTYLQVLDSLSLTAGELAKSLGLVVDNIDDVKDK